MCTLEEQNFSSIICEDSPCISTPISIFAINSLMSETLESKSYVFVQGWVDALFITLKRYGFRPFLRKDFI